MREQIWAKGVKGHRPSHARNFELRKGPRKNKKRLRGDFLIQKNGDSSSIQSQREGPTMNHETLPRQGRPRESVSPTVGGDGPIWYRKPSYLKSGWEKVRGKTEYQRTNGGTIQKDVRSQRQCSGRKEIPEVHRYSLAVLRHKHRRKRERQERPQNIAVARGSRGKTRLAAKRSHQYLDGGRPPLNAKGGRQQ